ncbi:MAG: phosphatidylglycerophosphatase A [Rickettsiales bacterium]|nr:phosphatidylglycerophosphatase A [Rickettsiales bacterium]
MEFIVTFFGVGNVRSSLDTVGSIASLPLWILLTYASRNFRLAVTLLIVASFLVLLFFVALFSVNIYVTENKLNNPEEVVIDEVLGQLLSFAITMFFIRVNSNGFLRILVEEHPHTMMAFSFLTPIVLFRVYNIWRPGLVNLVNSRMKNALGIMLDDVVAGIFAGLTNVLLIIIFLLML